MGRRSRAGGEPVKRRRRNTAAPKRRNASKVARRRSSFAAGQKTKVARLTRELNEALERQRATAEVLSAISRSKFELQSILQSVVDTASHLCGADTSVIFRLEGGVYRFAAGHSLDPAYIEHERRTPISPGPGTVIGRAVMTRQVVRIEDAWTDPLYEQKTAAKISGGRSMIGIPLMREGEPIGAIGLARTRVDPFTQREIELVKTFADQAVIAIENARLLNELRELLAQQTATADVLKVISRSAFDLNAVWRTLVELACTLCDAPQGLIELLDGGVYRLVMQKGYGEAFERYLVENPLRAGSSSGTGRAASTGVVSHIPDVLQDPGYRLTEGQRLGGYRANLAVPLLREQKVIGIFVLARPTPGPFTPRQIALVQTFADQAVIAIENVRLFDDVQKRTAELTEALDQQTATSEVLQVISSSPGDFEPVFATILEKATRICGANLAAFFLCEDDQFRVVTMHGVEPLVRDRLQGNLLRMGPNTVLGRLSQTKETTHITDVLAEPSLFETPTGFEGPVLALHAGARTLLGVPMLKENMLIGAILIYQQEVRPFTDKQIALVTNFANQAVIAIENTRLLNKLRQRTAELTELLEQQTATANVLEVISRSAFDLRAVFETVAESSVRLCAADRAFIFRFDGAMLRMASAFNAPPEFKAWVEQNPIRPGLHSGSARAALERKTIHIPDIFADPEYTFGARDIETVRTILAVPILKGDDLLGVIMVYRLEMKPFADQQIALVETFADQAAIAIENVRLLDALRHRTDDLGRSVEELRALGEVSQAVNSTLDLETVLFTIVANAAQLSGTEAGAIYVYDDRQREFHLRATYGMDQELIDALTLQHIGLEEPSVAVVFAQREAVQTADLNDEDVSDLNEITLRAGFRARLVAPLLRGEDVVGMLVVRRRTPGAFPQNTVDLIKTFAAQSAVAIENARLFQNVEASLEDLRTAQDRLVQTQKLASLGQLTAGIAHEIKNPLNFVNNFSGVSTELLDELRDAVGRMKGDAKTHAEIVELTDTLHDNLDKIVQHGKRADSIVKNMLLHSREGSGERRAVDINTLVEEAVNLAYHGARAERQGFNITLERSFDPAAGKADLFPQEITRVLLNLISNGFYAATNRKGQANSDGYEPTLTAATKNLGDRVEIRICDNGAGIPPEVKEKMFNPFFTTKPAGEGTGLGLSISHDIIVKQHAGRIEVDTRPGEFTEFRVVLPRAVASQAKRGGQA